MVAEASGQVNVLEGLSEEELAGLEQACQRLSFEAGEAVFREGDPGEDLYIVRTGRVRIAKAISLAVDRTLLLLGPGGVFGELAMVGEGARSASATALERTDVLALSRDGFDLLTEKQPALGLKVMGRFAGMLADRLRVTTDLLRDTVSWGLEVSGAAGLDLHRVIEVQAQLELSLSNGERVRGHLIKVDRSSAGTLLTISGTDGQLHLVPYHALVVIRLGKQLLGPSGAEG